jgi:hypothetical protein
LCLDLVQNCYYCTKNHRAHDSIENILALRDNYVQQQIKLSGLRVLLDVFSLYNVLVLFIVYGTLK